MSRPRESGILGVLVDRDGTIIVDVPYNGNPALVEPLPGARAALDRLRAAGVRVGVLTNQSGVGRGTISDEQMHAVNRRIEEMLGPFDGWFICPHAPGDGCECRKPKPKLVLDAARAWNLQPRNLAVIGDQQSDVDAARNAGARGVRVGWACTLAEAAESLLSA
jgi:D-glycero-D-manno-heptose 1,7-bisphosphate phosphatase